MSGQGSDRVFTPPRPSTSSPDPVVPPSHGPVSSRRHDPSVGGHTSRGGRRALAADQHHQYLDRAGRAARGRPHPERRRLPVSQHRSLTLPPSAGGGATVGRREVHRHHPEQDSSDEEQAYDMSTYLPKTESRRLLRAGRLDGYSEALQLCLASARTRSQKSSEDAATFKRRQLALAWEELGIQTSTILGAQWDSLGLLRPSPPSTPTPATWASLRISRRRRQMHHSPTTSQPSSHSFPPYRRGRMYRPSFGRGTTCRALRRRKTTLTRSPESCAFQT